MGSGARASPTGISKTLAASDRPHDQKRLCARRNRVGQQRIWRLMGQIFFAGEKPHERPALLRHMVTDGSAQHRIARLKRVEDRALRDWTLKLKLHLTV